MAELKDQIIITIRHDQGGNPYHEVGVKPNSWLWAVEMYKKGYQTCMCGMSLIPLPNYCHLDSDWYVSRASSLSQEGHVPSPPTCECGSEIAGSAGHSKWCPKYNQEEV